MTNSPTSGINQPQPQIHIDGDGNVGIGTTSPSAKLEVNGIIKTNTLEVSQGNIQIEAGGTLYCPGRMHIEGTEILFLLNSGGVRIGNRDGGGDLTVDGSLTAHGNVSLGGSLTAHGNLTVEGAKNFSIDHPLHPDTHKLVHSTLEGPEIAVFYRGEAQLSNGQVKVLLPDYFEALTRKENRTVLLTPELEEGTEISTLAASKVKDGKFTVKMTDNKNPSQKFYWEVKAIRADVDTLKVERAKITVE